MNETVLNIDGMHCDNCYRTVRMALEQAAEGAEVELEGMQARVLSHSSIDVERLVDAVEAAGYHAYTPDDGARQRHPRAWALGQLLLLVGAIALLGLGINVLFGYNVFNAIPVIDSGVSRGMLLGIGALTGLHCITMCGAVSIAATTAGGQSGAAPLLYSLGRLVSYTAVGALAGALGAVVSLDRRFAAVALAIAALCMVVMALRMAGVVALRLPFPRVLGGNAPGGSAAPLAIGLANAFMPCGPLQAMQLYALSTGSAFEGAVSMMLFCLGTTPAMLGVGLVARLANGKVRAGASKVAAAFLVVLSASMLARGMSLAGFSGLQLPEVGERSVLVSTVGDNAQYVSFPLEFDSYADIRVQRGIPVRLEIVADAGKITGCNNEVVMPEWGIDVRLQPGTNVVEFTPEQTGVFSYSCWMNMITNTVEVVG